jgi:hypothetical protein
MTRAGVIAVLLIGTMATANAAPQCYHASEIEADQAMHYQAKLMVLSDTCRSNSYTQFLRRNADVISSYQHQLIGYFRRLDGHRPEDAFDRFLTRLANQFALGAGQEPLDSLCVKAADFLSQALNFGKEEFRHFMAQQAVIERKSYQSCAD